MLRWPGHVPPGRYDTLVSSIDLAPTILQAARVDPPDEMPGLNLLRVAENSGRADRDTLFGEVFEHDVADIDDPAQSLLYRWVINGHWKLILPAAESESPELYDLARDPHETRNLAADHPDRVERLTRRVDDWWRPK